LKAGVSRTTRFAGSERSRSVLAPELCIWGRTAPPCIVGYLNGRRHADEQPMLACLVRERALDIDTVAQAADGGGYSPRRS